MHKNIIANTSAAVTLRQHLHERLDNFAVFEDNLILGPLCKVKNIDDFITTRELFWKNNQFADESFIRHSYNEFIDNLQTASSYTLWIGPAAHDQFMWAWLVHLFEELKIDWDRVTVKHLFNKKDSVFPYLTLGELRPEEFELCKDFEIKDEHIYALNMAYEALISENPNQILEICNAKNFDLPCLQQSMKSYAKTYPDRKTGLTIYEKALLKQCKERQQKSARIIGSAMCSDDYEHQLAFGDQFLFDQMLKMAQKHAKKPLIEIVGKVKDPCSMRFTEVFITETGKKVLAGEQNNIELNGIEKQIGGVALSSKNKTDMWFYDNGTLVNK